MQKMKKIDSNKNLNKRKVYTLGIKTHQYNEQVIPKITQKTGITISRYIQNMHINIDNYTNLNYLIIKNSKKQ